MKLKVGDRVRVIAGKDKGKEGKIISSIYLKDKISMSLSDLQKYISAENEISLSQNGEKIIVNSKGTDPYIVVDDFSEISNISFSARDIALARASFMLL